MKKIVLILCNLIIISILTGCNKDNEKFIVKKSAELNEIDGVTMTIKDKTLNETGATIIITDNTGKNNIYGEEYRIDKLVNDKWEKMNIIVDGNYAWTLIGYYVDEDNKLEMKINWEWLYGKLDSGEYRIVKSLSKCKNSKLDYLNFNKYNCEEYEEKFFSVEFTIK